MSRRPGAAGPVPRCRLVPMLLLLLGCTAQTTDEATTPAPDLSTENERTRPFADHEGATITLHGTVRAPAEGTIDVDVRVPDPAAPGGVAPQGKLRLAGPGTFSLSVPAGLGQLELQAFQRDGSDGPSSQTPFASVWLEVAEADLTVELVLAAGAREGRVRLEDGNPDPFGGAALDDRITLSGTLSCEGCPSIDLDLFQPDDDVPGGMSLLGKMEMSTGAYSLSVPRGFGPLILKSFADLDGDGPTPGDPMGIYEGNPVTIGRKDIDGVDIVLVVTEDGRMPGDGEPGGGGI